MSERRHDSRLPEGQGSGSEPSGPAQPHSDTGYPRLSNTLFIFHYLSHGI